MDDSDLCINSLNKFSRVYTHRFLGEKTTDEERNNYLIEECNNHKDISAKFICSIAYYDGRDIITEEGILNVNISKEPIRNNCFGFNPIFELDNDKTLAELSNEEKNNISARKLALIDLKRRLK